MLPWGVMVSMSPQQPFFFTRPRRWKGSWHRSWERGFPESYMSPMTACRGCIIKQVQDKWCIVILIKYKSAWLPQVSILSFHFNVILEQFSDIHLLEIHLWETSSLLFLLSTEENMIQVWKRLKRALTELHPRHLIPFQQQAWEQ